MAWSREAAGALAGTLSYLAVLLSQGLLAYAALGAAGPALGIPAAFGSVVVGGLLFALASRSASPTAGPSSATSLIFGGLVLQAAATPGFDAQDPAALLRLLALTSTAVLTMGLAQIALAALGLARLARFVPQPVLAGFMNGVSALMLLSQLPVLLGWPAGAWRALGWSAFAQSLPGALLLGAATAAAVWLGPRLLPRWPATLVGLGVGAALAAALLALAPGLDTGHAVGELPVALPHLSALLPWLAVDGHAWLRPQLGAAVTTGLVLALIGSLESLLNGLAVDQVTDRRSPPTRELLALGAGNLVGGLLGSLPLVLMRTRALPALQAGARTRWSAVLGCVLFALIGAAALPTLAPLPQAVLAGIMVTLAVGVSDRWTRDLAALWWAGQRSADQLRSLTVVGIVCAATIAMGFAAGVLLGVVASMLLFIGSMNRSLLRARLTAAAWPSRRIHAPAHEAWLRGQRQRIVILELEGALFFGSADRLAREADALPDEVCGLVLDFKRVSAIDASGSVVLSQVAQRLARRGVPLLLAGVTPQNRLGMALLALAGQHLADDVHWHVDLDHAVEALELRLLQQAQLPPAPDTVPLPASDLCRGLDAAACEQLRARMTLRRLAAGEALFRQGDAGDRLFVLCSGSLSVRGAELPGTGQRQRFLSLSPGMMLGETALLDGGGRSADAVADVPCEVLELTQAELMALRHALPEVAAHVFMNIAVHLSGRLRAASEAWRASAA